MRFELIQIDFENNSLNGKPIEPIANQLWGCMRWDTPGAQSTLFSVVYSVFSISGIYANTWLPFQMPMRDMCCEETLLLPALQPLRWWTKLSWRESKMNKTYSCLSWCVCVQVHFSNRLIPLHYSINCWFCIYLFFLRLIISHFHLKSLIKLVAQPMTG